MAVEYRGEGGMCLSSGVEMGKGRGGGGDVIECRIREGNGRD